MKTNADLTFLYRWCENKTDQKRLDKIIAAQPKMTQDNFWDIISDMVKHVRSDHTIKRWQILAENAERIMFDDDEE